MTTEQILSWAVVVAALTAAIIVAIKAPKSTWVKKLPVSKDHSEDWAPEYTKQEKVKLVGLQLLLIVPFFILIHYLKKIDLQWHFFCGQTWGVSHWTWYIAGILMVIMLVFLSGIIYQTLNWLKVLRHGQCPPPGQKVWKPQTIIRGDAAKRRAKLFLVLLVGLGMVFMVCLVVLLVVLQGLVTPEALTAKCG